MVTWKLPKGASSRKRISFLNTQFWSNDRCWYFVAKTIDYFLYTMDLILMFDFIFQQNMGFSIVFW
jgi:hypothetical protein